MADILKRLDQAPVWLRKLYEEIDTLNFGCEAFADDAEVTFGVTVVNGIDAIREFFRRLDTPLNTKHHALECWDGGDILIVRGEAEIIRKDDPTNLMKPPFAYFFTMAQGKIRGSSSSSGRPSRRDKAVARVVTNSMSRGPCREFGRHPADRPRDTRVRQA